MTSPDLISTPTATVADEDVSAPTDLVSVLHVEDNPADAMLIQEYLRDSLPSVVFDTVTRLTDLDAERACAVDCALLDLSLPDASGLEALIALRGMSEHLPIIVLTGFDDLQLGLSAVRYGADDYLIKNHVDGYTLERAVKYSIERRRLMFELASAEVATVLATAGSITADAATAAAVELSSVSAGRPEVAEESRAATGTHEVSVRVDGETGDYALSCRSCTWVAGRGLDDLHSWSARSLDQVLLSHVGFGVGSPAVTEPSAAPAVVEPPVSRRGVWRPRGWLRGNE